MKSRAGPECKHLTLHSPAQPSPAHVSSAVCLSGVRFPCSWSSDQVTPQHGYNHTLPSTFQVLTCLSLEWTMMIYLDIGLAILKSCKQQIKASLYSKYCTSTNFNPFLSIYQSIIKLIQFFNSFNYLIYSTI